MKLRKILFATITAVIAAIVIAGSITTLTWAAETPEPRTVQSDADSQPEIAPTFSSEEISSDAGIVRFGSNLLFAAKDGTVDQTARGLLLAAAKDLQVNSQSEYAFVAGNVVTFNAATEKDLFIAGNAVFIAKDAKVGRDIFAGASSLTLEADIPGDVSVAASRVTIKDATIKGNVNLDAGAIIFQGKVKIEGTLSYNDNAEIFGLTNVEYAKLETYFQETHTTTAGELWLSKMISVAGLFFTAAIIILVFPGVKKHIARETTAKRIGTDLALGLATIIVVPILSLALLISVFAASTSIFLIVVYCLIFYLAKVFVGAWLGHIVVEKLCHGTLPMLVEALIGILLITCAGMVPGFGILVFTFTVIMGAGLIISCLRSGSDEISNSDEKHVYYSATKTPTAKTTKTPAAKAAATPKSAAKKPSAHRATKSTAATPAPKKSVKTKTPKK